MCGIAGIVNPGVAPIHLRSVVHRMTDALVHRGPDDSGVYLGEGIGLGMRRLSIIDVDGGQQPVSSEDGLVQVVFNGEIYNYLELRSALRKRGHIFRTNSDTEVIAHLYEEKGIDAFEQLRGMFAIAVWDRRNRRLVLARDRIGKKPLFYARRGSTLLFGSEIKAILTANPSLAEPDVDALGPYLQYGFVPEPRTVFREIRKLPAAHWLTYRYESGEVAVEPYWRLSIDDDGMGSRSEAEVVEELDALLGEAVRIRLMSDVPLGIFLSGGLDSSTIVAYAHKAGLRPIKTFTIAFDRRGWDESPDAEVVARHFGTDHHVLRLTEQDFEQCLPDTVLTLVRHFDEPFGDPSALPTYHVSKLAREHVTVILSGDGGDELFAGYSLYKGIRFAELYRRVPRWTGRRYFPAIVENAAQWLPQGPRYRALHAARVLGDSERPFESRYFLKGSPCRPDVFRQILTADAAARLGSSAVRFLADDVRGVLRSDVPEVSKALYLGVRLALLEDMLVKVDRMSMAHSLEVRSPLLDHRLVDFVMRLPPSMKLRGWETKAILRDTIRRYVPPSTLRKRKQGFAVPLREWLRGGLYEMAGDFLEAGDSRLPPGVFNRAGVRNLLAQHRRGEADHSGIIWLLLNYAAWRDLYIDSREVRTAVSGSMRHAVTGDSGVADTSPAAGVH
ncbi:MAG TPA: asparagine synthase (glutamine-hydrolyzing) [Vicinamibacterales bacterium]|jgi:asparagine synthase (glutamine-hydrolysing)